MCFITAGMGGWHRDRCCANYRLKPHASWVFLDRRRRDPNVPVRGHSSGFASSRGRIEALQKVVDTTDLFPTEYLFSVLGDEKTTFTEAFLACRWTLYQGVKGVTRPDGLVPASIQPRLAGRSRCDGNEMGNGHVWVPAEARAKIRAIQAAEKANSRTRCWTKSATCAVPKGVLIKHHGGTHEPDLFELGRGGGNRIAKEVAQTRILSVVVPRRTLNWVVPLLRVERCRDRYRLRLGDREHKKIALLATAVRCRQPLPKPDKKR